MELCSKCMLASVSRMRVTFSGVYTNVDCFVCMKFKFNFVGCVLIIGYKLYVLYDVYIFVMLFKLNV